MTVRITKTKDGTSLWNPSCAKHGIGMLMDAPSGSRPGLSELRRALTLHGLSDHPVIATLTGVFLYNDYDEIRHRHRSVLKVIDAVEIKQSETVEHR